MSHTVFVLGAGHAGRGLALALRAAGVSVVGVHGRRLGSADLVITTGSHPESLRAADTVLVTVRDGQLEGALEDLAASPRLAAAACVLHASGSRDPRALGALRARGHPCGTFHPLVPLATPAEAAARLRGAWIGVDGDAAAQQVATSLADALGARVLRIPAGEKPRYHAAAVVASNFPTVLAAVAERLMRAAGVEHTAARGATLSLMSASVANLLDAARGTHELAEALTGPVVRGDVETIRRHLDALRGSAELLDAYRALTRLAVAMARQGGARPEFEAIEEELER